MAAEKSKGLIAFQKEIAQLEDELQHKQYGEDNYHKQLNSAQEELNNIHQVLDNVPFAPPRKEKESNDEYSCVQRLSMWVANFMVNVFKGEIK